jgi:predicted GIY-YIG superfamily endonuclease
MIYIYGLIERQSPIKGIRYIGLTNNPDDRLTSHRSSSDNTLKATWVNELRASGNTIDMIILDQASTRADAAVKEAAWIQFGIDKGWELTNSMKPRSDGFNMSHASINEQDATIASEIISAVFDGRREMITHVFDIRRDMLNLHDKIQTNKQRIITVAPPRAIDNNKRRLTGAIRQTMIGSFSLVLAVLLRTMFTMFSFQGDLIIYTLVIVAFLMAIYPTYFVGRICALWLFGYSVLRDSGAPGKEYHLIKDSI